METWLIGRNGSSSRRSWLQVISALTEVINAYRVPPAGAPGAGAGRYRDQGRRRSAQITDYGNLDGAPIWLACSGPESFCSGCWARAP